MLATSSLTRGKLPPVKMVLLVDDDPDTAALWRAILFHHAPAWCVATASNGAEALRLACELEPDLILMDLVMPQLDGLAATAALKANPETARIPVIAVTGALYSSQRVLEAGCDGYLLKPVSEASLLDEIRRALRLA